MPYKIVKESKDFQTCKTEMIHHYMNKFSKGKLKTRQDKPIRNPSQAIAMALSIADKECLPKMKKSDIKILENKLDQFLQEKDSVTLSNVKNARVLIRHYLSEGRKKKATQTANRVYKTVNHISKKKSVPQKILREAVSLQNLLR